MSFFRSLFRREQKVSAGVAEAEAECPHTSLVPHWDSAAVIGHREQVSHYKCESCHGTFSREEGERRLSQAADRLRISEEERRERHAR